MLAAKQRIHKARRGSRRLRGAGVERRRTSEGEESLSRDSERERKREGERERERARRGVSARGGVGARGEPNSVQPGEG